MTNTADQQAYKSREALKGRTPRTTTPLTDAEWTQIKALIDSVKSERANSILQRD